MNSGCQKLWSQMIAGSILNGPTPLAHLKRREISSGGFADLVGPADLTILQTPSAKLTTRDGKTREIWPLAVAKLTWAHNIPKSSSHRIAQIYGKK